jgi:hypothetical protein
MANFNFLTLLFIFNFHLAKADNYAVTGKITDSLNKPIESGNAIILSAKDSSIIKGNFFMSGQFQVSEISENTIILKITAAGFQDYFQSIKRESNDSTIDVGILQLKTNNTLKEVEIISKIPLFERDGEKVKVNVENTSLSSVGTVLDVLKKSPTVMVNNNDVVSVFGKGNAIIYLDGQIVSVDILKTIPSSEIKEIEIIANPSAKYDASGNAVINIITKKNNLEGYNGNLIQNTLYSKYIFTYTGLRFNYKRKKWSTYVSYGFPHGITWDIDEYYRNVKSNDTTTTEMKNKLYTTRKQTNSNYYKIGLTYTIDSSSTIGFQYNGFYSKNKNITDNVNDVYKNAVPQLSIQTSTIAKPILFNNSAIINYSKKLDTLKSELTAAIQYGNFSANNLDEITQQIIIGNTINKQVRRNKGINDIQVLTSQIDLNKSFNKKWTFESGLKNSYILNQSEINLENYSSSDEWISDPTYFNGYKYTEDILAGYTQLRFSKNKINIRAGARAEYTNSKGFSKITNTQVINRTYLNIFPSAYLGYDFTKDLNASLTYTSRISRPTFQDMNPFINFIDSLSSFRGNPYLLPSYTHSAEASIVYMKEASLTCNYTRTNGAMNLVVDKLNDGTDSFIATTKNLNYSETYSAGITIPYELSWWTTYNYFGYMLNKFSYNSEGVIIENKKPMFYVSLYDEFRVKKIFSMEVTFEYTSSGVDGIFGFDPFYNLGATLKKTFFKDKLTCRLIANDILSTSYTKSHSKVEGYNVNYISKNNSHYFLFSLNYRFGKLKANDYKDKAVNQEEYDRIKMNK